MDVRLLRRKGSGSAGRVVMKLDKIIWERDPRPGEGLDLQPPRFGWMLIPAFIILGIIVAYFIQ